MRSINDADYYGIVTNEKNYTRGIRILQEVRGVLEATKGDTESFLPFLTEEVHREVVALLGFMLTIDGSDFSIDPSAASIFNRHGLLGKMLPLYWARLDLPDGELKTKYSKSLDDIEHLTTTVPDGLPH
jgi:hypothetical protein